VYSLKSKSKTKCPLGVPSASGPFHPCLVVTLGGEHFLVDVGFGPGSPRYPLRFSFTETEEVESCEGER